MTQTVRIPPAEGQAIAKPTDVFDALLPEAAALAWSISDADWFTAKDESTLNVDDLRDEVEAAPRGLLMEWPELRRLLDDLLQVIDGTFVGYRDREAIPLRAGTQHEELIPGSEIVVSAIDSSYWLVTAADPVLRRLMKRFPGTEPVRDPAAPPQDTPPTNIGGGEVLRFAVIDDDVRPTGATKHSYGQVVQGDVVPGPPMQPLAALAIVQYEDEPGSPGYYLLYLDSDWQEVTDTWHETLEDAVRQAEFEYEGITAKFETPPDLGE